MKHSHTTHFERLSEHVTDLKERKILDIGSGRGGFLLDAALHHAEVHGIELNSENVTLSKKRLMENQFNIEVIQGTAEELPYRNESFGFVNLAEVIEHVDDPLLVLKEVHRVLKPGGMVYISVPTRYSFKDPHFKLYFVNWLPRRFSDWYIGLFNKHKSYSLKSGRQRLSEMHYFTLKVFRDLAEPCGFFVVDIRSQKIKRLLFSWLLLPVYFLMRHFYFDTYHLLLVKKKKPS